MKKNPYILSLKFEQITFNRALHLKELHVHIGKYRFEIAMHDHVSVVIHVPVE